MTTSYDKTKNPFNLDPGAGELNSIGLSGVEITADPADFDTYVRITVFGGGEITILPAKNDDSATLTFTPPNGWVSPWLVRRVTAIAGGTSVFSIEN